MTDPILLKHYIQEYITATALDKPFTKAICLETIRQITLMNYLINNNTGDIPALMKNQAY